MAAEHKHIAVLSADPMGNGVVVHFSDGTTTLFQAHFLYEVRDHDGNIALTGLSEEALMGGFDD